MDNKLVFPNTVPPDPTTGNFLLVHSWGLIDAAGDADYDDEVPPENRVDYKLLWEHIFAIRRLLRDGMSPREAQDASDC